MKNIIIKGEFTIEGLEPQMNNFKQPLKFLQLRIGYEPPIFIERMSSTECNSVAEKAPKGCGKTDTNEEDFIEKLSVTCGVNDYLCPECRKGEADF